MSIPAPLHRYTYQDYLALDELSNHKNEYLGGEIFAMAGGTARHAALILGVASALYQQLRGRPCRAYSSDLRVRVLETGLATYPDVTVICGPIVGDPEGRDTATNPTVLVEVLSDSTEDYDRGEKRQHYQKLPTLREYVIVAQHEPRIELWRRTGGDWVCDHFGPGRKVPLGAIGCEIDVDDLYAEASR